MFTTEVEFVFVDLKLAAQSKIVKHSEDASFDG